MGAHLLRSVIHSLISSSSVNSRINTRPGDYFIDLPGWVGYWDYDKQSCIARWVIEVRKSSHHVKLKSYCDSTVKNVGQRTNPASNRRKIVDHNSQ